MQRIDGRSPQQLRKVEVVTDYVIYPEGSVLFSMGNTKVLCNASIEDRVPKWISAENKQIGWITAEYAMLPRATQTRSSRETMGLKGRTQEIKRLIGRSLRAAFDLTKLGERTCIVDCDVLQADGGTRTASITGAWIALKLALDQLCQQGLIEQDVFLSQVAAVSVGVVEGEVCLDLCYQEDAGADVDANIVMTDAGHFVEIQGTAEKQTFPRSTLDVMLQTAENGIKELFEVQRSAL